MRTFSLNTKFSIVVAVFVLTVLGVFGIGLYDLIHIKESQTTIVERYGKRRLLAKDALINAYRASTDQKDLLLSRDPAAGHEAAAAYEKSMNATRETLDKLTAIADHTIRAQVTSAVKYFKEWEEVSKTVNALALAQRYDEADAMLVAKSEPLNDIMEDNLVAISKIVCTETETAESLDQSEFEHAKNLEIGLSILGICLGVGLAVPLIRGISRAVKSTAEALSQTAQQVAATSQEVAEASLHLSDTALVQTSSLAQTTAATREMHAIVGRNSKSAQDSHAIARKNVEDVNRGKKVVRNMMNSMDQINSTNRDIGRQTDECNRRLADIVQVINEIGEKTKVINEIVFQTKLLSFNASVEAARAGEHGRGFSIVAEEVGNLAQMSGDAAKGINALLEVSTQKVQMIIAESKTQIETIIQENTEKVAEGAKVAEECSAVLEDIARGIASVAEMIHSIAVASDDQAKGVGEINHAVHQLEQVTQSNAATAREATEASEQLENQAGQMKGAVDKLLRLVRGGSAPSADDDHYVFPRVS